MKDINGILLERQKYNVGGQQQRETIPAYEASWFRLIALIHFKESFFVFIFFNFVLFTCSVLF